MSEPGFVSAWRSGLDRVAPGGALGEQGYEDRLRLEADWRSWLETLFPQYVTGGFADRHVEFWDWVWSITRGAAPPAFIAIWPRGGGKSTSSEIACAAVGARETRRYILYICETQDQADDHVANIGGLLESAQIENYYPELGSRKVGKYGTSKGWRRNRLRTAAGLTIDAIGLDTAARGVKLDDARPDMMVLDDLDSEADKLETVEKKIRTLTRKLLMAGSNDVAVLAVQNLVHPDSIFSQLADGRADWLANRVVSGPHPAIRDFSYEQREGKFWILGGTATWDGQPLDVCQHIIHTDGISAFLSECQQEVQPPAGGMFDHLDFDQMHVDWDDLPIFQRITVWVDPAVTDTDRSDAHGIQASGLGVDGKVYSFWSWEARTSPEDSLRRAILKAVELGADTVGVETDQGGDTWRTVFNKVWRELVEDPDVADIHDGRPEHGCPVDAEGKPTERPTSQPRFKWAKASAGHGSKVHRASQMLVDYEQGRIRHVIGTHNVLERALRRFPRTKPYDLVDASVWAWHELTHGTFGFASGSIAGVPEEPYDHERKKTPPAAKFMSELNRLGVG